MCRWVQNAKYEPPRGSEDMLPRKFLKMHALRLNLVLSEAQNCYAKDRLWKSTVREISLAVSCYFLSFEIN